MNEIEYKKIQPYKIPKIKTKVEKSCNNCMDSIVCYGLDEPDNPEKAKTCKDWALDIVSYQNLLEEQEEKP